MSDSTAGDDGLIRDELRRGLDRIAMSVYTLAAVDTEAAIGLVGLLAESAERDGRRAGALVLARDWADEADGEPDGAEVGLEALRLRAEVDRAAATALL